MVTLVEVFLHNRQVVSVSKADVLTSKRAAFPKLPCAAALAALACRLASFLE